IQPFHPLHTTPPIPTTPTPTHPNSPPQKPLPQRRLRRIQLRGPSRPTKSPAGEQLTAPPGLDDFLNRVQMESGLYGGQADPKVRGGNLHTLRVRRSSLRRESVGGALGGGLGVYEDGGEVYV
ncbi:hypothetical protein HDV00_002756, partial [Rhizophlyctis rosea]